MKLFREDRIALHALHVGSGNEGNIQFIGFVSGQGLGLVVFKEGIFNALNGGHCIPILLIAHEGPLLIDFPTFGAERAIRECVFRKPPFLAFFLNQFTLKRESHPQRRQHGQIGRRLAQRDLQCQIVKRFDAHRVGICGHARIKIFATGDLIERPGILRFAGRVEVALDGEFEVVCGDRGPV